ncbi:hypothetical protein B0H14DRAFT_3442188 [Mycena olivaceomarginata]|nr:hypothetical protein B0H14DRAFT_3442188 [Mycena olivaceomarginata]
MYRDVVLFCDAPPHIGTRVTEKAGGVVCKEGHGGREGDVAGGGWEKSEDALALFGLRLELVAEVRRAVGRGGGHPKKEVERRRKVSSVLKEAAKTNEETLEMEYVQKLVSLSASQARYRVAAVEARHARGADGTYTPGVLKEDRVRWRTQEKVEKDLERVKELEEALDVVERWTMDKNHDN